MKADLQSVYEFGAFRLDARERLLLCDGVAVPVTPKSLEILRVLLENAGRLVTKQQLLEQVWPDTVVEEANLSRNIFTLRRLLGDVQETPKYIETVPKAGYRFIAPVHVRGEEIGSAIRPAPEKSPPGRGIQRRIFYAAGLLVFVLVAAFFGWRELRPAPRSPGGRIMLVVLPFQNLTGDPTQDFFSDGFTEEMITELGRMHPEQLAVIARTSSMQYRNTQKGVDQIGKELNVQYVLEGSVRRAGNRVRISAQLIQVQDQTHLWAQNYERDLSNVIELQSEVAQAIGREIELKLSPAQNSRLARARVVDPQAYESYLLGRSAWNRRTREGFDRAIDYFNQAIARDGGVPEFYAGLADAYALMGSLPNSSMPRPEAMEKARGAAQKALSIDDSLAEAHTSLAFVLMHYDWNWAEAEKEFLRALQLNPGYATAHQWYAYYLIAMAKKEDAVREMRRAEELDPLSPIISRDVADMLFLSRRYDEAIEQCKKALERDPNFPLSHMLMSSIYHLQKNYPEMTKEFERARQQPADKSWLLGIVGPGQVDLGHRAEAERTLAELEHLDRQGQEVAHSIVTLEAALGRRDQAFAWLEKSYQQRIGSMILLKVDPMMDPLRSDPRFDQMLRRMNLP